MKGNKPMNQITLPIAELKPALTGLGKIISRSATLPVLRMIRIERTKDGWVTLTGTDLERFVTVRLEQPSEGEPVLILVEHEDLQRIAKRCGQDESLIIEKQSDEKSSVTLPIGNQTTTEYLASLPAEEFPTVPRIKTDPVSLANEIRQSLLEAFQCASHDETRQILQGAFIDVSDQKCQQIIATDGRHLFASNTFTLPLKESALIPSNKFLMWREFNHDGEWQLRVEPATKDTVGSVQISSRRWRFITRQIEGNYPNWRQVVPQPSDSKTTVQLSAETAESVVRLIPKIPCNDKVNHTIGLNIANQKLMLRGRSAESENWTDLQIDSATVTGNPVVVYLNRNYLTKALSFGLTEIQIIDALTPVRFANDGRQMVIMPMRVD
jgi:DNA polymerase III sliding clamp (beta) subunit (PCNA family)